MPRVGSIRRFHGPTGGDRRPFWAVGRATGTLGGCVSCPLSTRHSPENHRCGTLAVLCLNLKRLIRGEHQVPDQADQDQREGPAAQQGRQVLSEDRDPQGP
ncbi:hypothetical protein EJ357_15375 [Streptomyces cyaneochromogenes]|uniref:Uncharacterized protein n=1 Tax=Streptomyces cyaneochromogenes TaxID=2496836 RepID=A0A3S9M6B8_9ACTN|nr:hypothetical protein EJ357_15375 [Streptomyces cyaneochromogenes]